MYFTWSSVIAFYFTEFQTGLSKLSIFLQNILLKESLSCEADTHRKECIILVEGMNNSLNNMKNNNLKDGSLLNAGLSLSSQSLHESNGFNGISEEGIPRSESLPDMSSCGQSEDSETWQASRTKKVCICILFYARQLFNRNACKKDKCWVQYKVISIKYFRSRAIGLNTSRDRIFPSWNWGISVISIY